jgi:hypothetical protein
MSNTIGADFVHEIPCPARFGPKDTGPLPPQTGANQWQSIWSASGWWSDVEIYLEAPEEWGLGGDGGVKLRLWSLTGAIRSLIAETTVGESGMRQIAGPGSDWRGIALSGAGHPGSGWLVEAQSPNTDVAFASAQISGEVWGTESTPEGVGNTPGHTIVDHRMVSRASHLMGWPIGATDPAATPPAISTLGPWLPILVTTTGELVVSSTPPLVSVNLGTAVQALIGIGAQSITSFSCANANAADRFFQLFDSVAVVLAGAVPRLTFRVPAGTTVSFGTDFFTSAGLTFSTGLRWAFSTTAATFTPAAAADQITQITYHDASP